MKKVLLFCFSVTVILAQQSSKLLFEGKSKYSHVKVIDKGALRSLYFVRDNGQEVVETTINKKYPHKLEMVYISFMLSSYLINAKQSSCLIVGLGGGAMVHFLNHHFPLLAIDAVEIDPLVTKLAKSHFFLKENNKNRFFVEDGFHYLKRIKKTYDVIYMDAYLKPSGTTDSQGMPLHHKTFAFFKHLQTKVNQHGLIVINMNLHNKLLADLKIIKKAFAQVYFFQEPTLGNLIVVASKKKKRLDKKALAAKATILDKKYQLPFSFAHVVHNQKFFKSF